MLRNPFAHPAIRNDSRPNGVGCAETLADYIAVHDFACFELYATLCKSGVST